MPDQPELEPGATCTRPKQLTVVRVGACGRPAVDRDEDGEPRCSVHRGADRSAITRRKQNADMRRAYRAARRARRDL